jgi:hypothetical protein
MPSQAKIVALFSLLCELRELARRIPWQSLRQQPGAEKFFTSHVAFLKNPSQRTIKKASREIRESQ